MTQQPVLELKDVTVIRDGNTILKDINWSVMPDEHWVVLGQNGSGKTSLLKVVTGLLWPTVGSVWCLGERFGETNVGELRKRIGWVTTALSWQCKDEDCAGSVVLSGYDNSIGLWREDFTDDEMKRAAELLRLVGADNIVDRPWGVLSAGERQRTLIARALVGKPEILILDEPCASLDISSKLKLLNDLDELRKQRKFLNLILVTHHLDEVTPWINRAIFIKNGQIQTMGETTEVMTSESISTLFDHPLGIEKNGQSWIISSKINATE